MIISMKIYVLTFFIWLCCLTSFLFSQTDTPLYLNQSTSPSFQEQIQPSNEQTPSVPVDPNPNRETFNNLRNRPEDDFQSKFMNMLIVLGLLIGFMVLASWMLKRLMRTRINQLNSTSSIKVLETRHLSPKSTLYLLDVMGQGLLIAESQTGISHLATLPLEEESLPSPPSPPIKQRDSGIQRD